MGEGMTYVPLWGDALVLRLGAFSAIHRPGLSGTIPFNTHWVIIDE
jgi:hypothetical protein